MKSNGYNSPCSENEFRVGEWLVQPGANRISKGGRTTRVEPKVMEVLVCLAERPGETVSRDYLLESLWPDAHVTEDALNRSISKLRKVFDDNPKEPSFIETIPKAGYRLIAPVSQNGARAVGAAVTSNGNVSQANQGEPVPLTSRDGFSLRPLHIGIGLAIAVALASVWWLWRQTTLTSETSPAASVRITPFTTYPGYEILPSFSPDGNQVAFAWKGEAGDNWDIYIKQIDTETPHRLTAHDDTDISPAWSPDGRFIAFVRRSESECGIYAITPLGNQERKLASCSAESDPQLAWSPDGKWLAYTERSTSQSPYSIYLLSLDTREKRQLTSPPSRFVGDVSVSFSPDGETLGFVRSSALGVEDIYLLPASGGEPMRLTFDNLKVHGLVWTPDGERIVYSSNRGGSFSLWQIPVSGGEPEWVAAGGKSAENPALSKRGNLLVYEQWTSETNIWEARLSSGKEVSYNSLITSTQWDESPQYSPDGERIAFISDRSGAAEVWIADRSSSNPVRLTAFNGSYTRSPRWSPDSKRIAFDNPAEGTFDIYVIGIEGGMPRRLTDESGEDRVANWSRDGRWIYFASNRDGSWQVWKMPSEGGEAIRVTSQGGFASAESPDGKWLYYTKNETPGLWLIPVAGGDETLVFDQLQPVDWNNWVVNEKGIYFIDRKIPHQPELAFFDLATGQHRTVAALPRLLYKSGLSLSPDGQSVLYTRVDKNEADLILVKNFH